MIRRGWRQQRRYRAYGAADLERIPQLRGLTTWERLAIRAVAAVLPFRVNSHVLEELIRWEDVPQDPIFQLTFPQPGMLRTEDLQRMMRLVAAGDPEAIRRAADRIRQRLNPHPAGQLELNVPRLHGKPQPGLQHKYRETVLVFPRQGQTCHAYCTYCFRWPQFVGMDELRFAVREARALAGYLREHREVSDVLITGGDPLVMRTSILRRYVEPLLAPDLAHVTSIRIGTKAATFWPRRFLSDPDADDLLRLFEDVRRAGRQLALMAHVSHPRELEPEATARAFGRIRAAGAIVRTQAPLVRHVNDDPLVWAEMWRRQVAMGLVPYYMFVERDTGAQAYFAVPLVRAHEIHAGAVSRVGGLARTVRGPSMSATPGKVLVLGPATVAGEKVLVLSFEQARDPAWVKQPFFAAYDRRATWLTELKPAFGQREFFFQPLMRRMKRAHCQPAWPDRIRSRPDPVIFGHVEWE